MAGSVNSHQLEASGIRRSFLCRLVFAFIFAFLVYYAFSNTLVHQLKEPVLVFPYVDVTYWIFHLLKVPEFIAGHNKAAWCFDILMFASCIFTLIFPRKRLLIAIFFATYFIYFIIFNSYGTQHTHSKIGILLIPLPFLFTGRSFLYIWEAMRYFTLFVYADAFVWKIFRFNFLTKDHGSLVIRKNFVAYMYYHPNSFFSNFYSWLLAHNGILQMIFVAGLIMEACFIIGFFTKRFDRLLLVFSILLPVGFLFLSDAFFFEQLVLSFTLFGFRKMSQSSSGIV